MILVSLNASSPLIHFTIPVWFTIPIKRFSVTLPSSDPEIAFVRFPALNPRGTSAVLSTLREGVLRQRP